MVLFRSAFPGNNGRNKERGAIENRNANQPTHLVNHTINTTIAERPVRTKKMPMINRQLEDLSSAPFDCVKLDGAWSTSSVISLLKN